MMIDWSTLDRNRLEKLLDLVDGALYSWSQCRLLHSLDDDIITRGKIILAEGK